jgi:hypothetical protein
VSDTRLEGNTRLVTFGNGMTAREDIIAVDESRRRVEQMMAAGFAVIRETLEGD